MSDAKSVDRLLRGFIPRDFIHRLFEELNISRQCATGAGGVYIPEYADGPSSGFYANDLGFGWRNGEKDVVQTTRTLDADNKARKDRLKDTHHKLQEKIIAQAKRERARPELEPFPEEQGCTGCSSCVAGARIAPSPASTRIIRLAGTFTWLPKNPNRVGRRVTRKIELEKRRLREDPKIVQARRDVLRERFARLKSANAMVDERRAQRERARSQMDSRRAEEKTMRRAARRAAGGAASNVRR